MTYYIVDEMGNVTQTGSKSVADAWADEDYYTIIYPDVTYPSQTKMPDEDMADED
jgi:hypothetical protein